MDENREDSDDPLGNDIPNNICPECGSNNVPGNINCEVCGATMI